MVPSGSDAYASRTAPKRATAERSLLTLSARRAATPAPYSTRAAPTATPTGSADEDAVDPPKRKAAISPPCRATATSAAGASVAVVVRRRATEERKREPEARATA